MSRTGGPDVLQQLSSLASEWAKGRGSVFSGNSGITAGDNIGATGPGMLYQWSDGGELPVSISHIPDGDEVRPSPGHARHLFIRPDVAGIELHAAGATPKTLGTGTVGFGQLGLHILSEGTYPTSEARNRELSLIICGQRLVAHCLDVRQIGSERPPARNRLADELQDWLAGEMDGSIKLADAAKHFGKSPRQLIRILKETTGSGFAEHLSMHRLTRARNLLMRTDVSIMDVARRSGFNSREQFIRSFNKAFDWTPLQFRKAWNRASLSNSDLAGLCRISDRAPVQWVSPDRIPSKNGHSPEPVPITLVIANALHEIVEIFSVDADGEPSRTAVLDRGGMIFISRDTDGSRWLARATGARFEKAFVTPRDHAVAVISPDL